MSSLLGTAPPTTVRAWFTRLAEGGHSVADLETRPCGASDGQVVDGLHCLIGFQRDEAGG